MFKKMGKLEIAINIVAVLIIIVLAVIIGKYLTSTKEAAYVEGAEDESANIAQAANTSNNSNTEENRTDVIVLNQTNNDSNSIQENTNTEVINIIDTNTAVTNTTQETNTSSEVTNSTSTNETQTENTTSETDNKKEEKNNTSGKDTKNPIYSERKGTIYLSFDDGPSSNITPKVLDILKEEGIKATFFLCNFSDDLAHLVKREAEEGHTVAIHGYSHQYSKIYKSKDAFMDNVYSLQKKIKDATGITSMYVRFPGGSSNTVSRKYSKGIMTALSKELLSKGFKYFDWNVCAEDAGSAKNSKDVYNYTVNNLKKNRQNMVLMHDFAGNKKGLDALRDIIKYGKKNGYKFMAVDDETPMFAQHINN